MILAFVFFFRSEGYRSESDIEDEEPFDMDSDGSEGSTSRVSISNNANPSIKITTPQTGNKPGSRIFLLISNEVRKDIRRQQKSKPTFTNKSSSTNTKIPK